MMIQPQGWRRAALFGGAALSVCVFGGAQAQDTSGATLTEVVVTAQKREQNLQDVPVAVTAINQDMLLNNRVTNVADLNSLAPNLTVRPSPGGVGIPLFTMRGIFSTGSQPGAEKQVSIYVDGVYIGSSRSSIFDLPEISRIEVLRGPQGTLFGRNSTVGAISIVTRDPPGVFGVRQELSYGNYAQFRSKTRLDLPTWNGLTGSLTYVHDQRHGDIRNLGAGQVWDRTGLVSDRPAVQRSPKYLGSKDENSVFATVKLAPTDAFSLVYKFDYTVNHYSPEGVAPLAVAPTFAGIIAAQATPVAFDVSGKRPKAVNNAWTITNLAKTYGHSFTANVRADEYLTFKNILAYRYSYAYGTYQYDGLGGLINTGAPIFAAFLGPAAAGSSVGAPFILLGLNTEAYTKQWSEELQVNYDGRLVNITAGALYAKQDDFSGPPPGYPSAQSFRVFPGGRVPPTFPPVAQSYNWARSKAAYIQGEFHVTPQIDLVGGYRITQDKKGGEYINPDIFSFTYKKAKPAAQVGVNYRPMRDMLVYAKYSTSYMAGGSVAGFDFGPETVKSWEGGFKADFLDRRVRTNVALFDAKYHNLQNVLSGLNLGITRVLTLIINSGDAHAKGVEFEGAVVPMRGLTLSTGVSYTHFEYTSITPLLGTLDNYRPTWRPKWTANLAADYRSEPVFGEARVTARIDANYSSKQRVDPNPFQALAAFKRYEFMKGYWLVNGRIGLGGMKVSDVGVEIAAWGKNLTNSKSMSYPNEINNFMMSSSFVPARTVGIDLILSY